MSKRKSPAPATDTPAQTSAPYATSETLQRHPLSEMFSLPMTEGEREALAEHIAKNAQIQPIILYENQVLDGWERYLACRKGGITPVFKEYLGPSPAAVAFGANVLRRRLSALQKALLGAKYLVHAQDSDIRTTQAEVAKQVCVSLQRLNQMVKLLRKADENGDAARVLSLLNTDPDISYAQAEVMMVDAGLIDPNLRTNGANRAAPKTAGPDDDSDEDDDDDDDDGADEDVDALHGADIDALLDDIEADDAPKGKGKSKDDTPTVGTRRDTSVKRARETPASALAQAFKALTEPERTQFVVFAWGALKPAVVAAVEVGRVALPEFGVQADAGKGTMADMAGALGGVNTAASAAAKAASDKPPRKPRQRGADTANEPARKGRQRAAVGTI